MRSWANDSTFVKITYPHRFPPKKTHPGFMLAHGRETLARAAKLGPIDVAVMPRRVVEPTGKELVCVDARFAKDPTGALEYGRSVMCFDEGATDLPLVVELYDPAGETLGVWSFTDVRINEAVPDGTFTLTKK